MNEFRDEVFFQTIDLIMAHHLMLPSGRTCMYQLFYHILRDITGALSVDKSAVKPHRQNIELRIKL